MEHTLSRLAYERSELGPVARFGGDLTAVILQAFARTHGAEKPDAEKTDFGFLLRSPVTLPRHLADEKNEIELSADDWGDLMQASGYEVTLREPVKRGKSTAAPLINPTAEDAARLQAIWNADAARRAGQYAASVAPSTVRECSQTVYSAHSGGAYSPFQTIDLDATGRRIWPSSSNRDKPAAVCRIRQGQTSGGASLRAAYTVIRIADKPAKPLPIDWSAAEALGKSTQEEAA